MMEAFAEEIAVSCIGDMGWHFPGGEEGNGA